MFLTARVFFHDFNLRIGRSELYSYFQMSLDWRFNKYTILAQIQNSYPQLYAVILNAWKC